MRSCLGEREVPSCGNQWGCFPFQAGEGNGLKAGLCAVSVGPVRREETGTGMKLVVGACAGGSVPGSGSALSEAAAPGSGRAFVPQAQFVCSAACSRVGSLGVRVVKDV